MGTIRVLTESDLRAVVGFGADELSTVESAFPLISSGRATMPPIMRIDVPEHNGEIDVKSAHLPGHPGIAVKVSAGFFDNPSKGLPSLGGLMMVLDSETGVPKAALFDNGFLTDLRTGLAGAVAARHLARAGVTTAGILGAGTQARVQLEALLLVRSIDRAVVWARRREQAVAFQRWADENLGLRVEPVATPSEAAFADILVTTTPSTVPLVTADMLHPGMHVTAVGSDAEHKQELAADAIRSADRVVCDSIDQSGRLGELRSALAAGFDATDVIELGAVIGGTAAGRLAESDITICDLTGTGAQDTAIAGLAVRRCAEAGLGVEIET